MPAPTPPTAPQPAAPTAPDKDAAPKIVIPPMGKVTPPTEKPPVKAPEPKVEPKPDPKPSDPDAALAEIPLPDGARKMSPAEYAAARRDAKIEKAKVTAGVPEMEAELAATKAQLADLEKHRNEAAQLARQLAEYEARVKEQADEIEAARLKYFDTHQPSYDANDDAELQTANSAVWTTLATNMPPRINGALSKLNSNAKSAFHQSEMDKALMNFGAAMDDEANPNRETVMRRAVSYMAQLSGHEGVKIDANPDHEVLLDVDDNDFLAIEAAMVKALPSFKNKIARQAYVTEQAPLLAEKARADKVRSTAQNMRNAIFLDEDAVAAIAKKNPLDARVIMHSIIQHSPELRQYMDNGVAYTAPFVARMVMKSEPLLSNDPAAIAAHRQSQQRDMEMGADFNFQMQLGRVAPFIISQMMGEVQALRARAGDISANENPGSSKGGDSDSPTGLKGDVSMIPLPDKR